MKIYRFHVCWVHTSSLCVSKKKAISSCREGRPEWSRQEEGWWEGQDPCEWAQMAMGRQQQLGHYSSFLTWELPTEDVNAPPPPPPPLRGRNDRMRVTKMSGKRCTFHATKSGPGIVKKRGCIWLLPGDFFKKGVFFLFFSHLFGFLRNYSEFRGVHWAFFLI